MTSKRRENINLVSFICLSFFLFLISILFSNGFVKYQNRKNLRSYCWQQCYMPQPSASADNTDLGFDKSWYHAQPHPIIV